MNYWGNVSRYYYQSSSSPATQYHGLINQGATCYLNSVLQVLFMTEDFREAVKQHKQENPDTKCIDCDLTPLFDDLEQREAYTFKITNTLGIKTVYEQQDAAEYFEKILRLTSPEASKIFRGQLTRTTECSTCHSGPKSDGAFWHLPLELVESHSQDYSVVNGIEEFFRDSDLSGENQMYCDECDDKSDAKIKCAIKDHPEVLMLLLKRFEFDYRYMAYVKINCTVAVPYTLQIPGNQTYELYAVVDHSGDLRSGHYTATIKSQDDDQWYNFNDTKVTLCDHQPFQVDTFEKSRSAYLLFYRKKKVHAADTCPQDSTEVSAPGGCVDDRGNDSAGVDDVRHQESLEVADILDPSYQRCKQESSSMHARCDDPQQVCVDKQRDEDRMVVDVNRVTYTKYDLCYFQDSVSDSRQNRPKDDHWCEQGRNSRRTRHEQPRQDKRDVREVEEQRTEDDKRANRKETDPNLSRVVEDQDKRRLDSVRQNMNEGLESKQKIGQQHTLQPLNVDKQEPDVKVDEEDETGADDRKVASGSAKGLTKYDLMEQKTGDDKYAKRKETPMMYPDVIKGVEGQDTRRSDDVRQDRLQQKVSVKHSSHKDSVDKQANKPTQCRTDSSLRQTKLTDSRKVAENRGVEGAERTGYNDSAVEGRHGSRTYAKRTDSEVRETRSIIKGSSETDLTVKTTEETVRQDIVLVGVRNLHLSESPSQQPQQRGTKRVITHAPEENETQGTIQSIPKKQKKHARWWPPRLPAHQKPNRKEKKKQKKPTGCRISCISPTSESD